MMLSMSSRHRSLPASAPILALALSLGLGLATGCAGPDLRTRSPASLDPSGPGSESAMQGLPDQQVLTQGQLEVTYVLGHDLHRLTLDARGGTVQARSFLDREVLREASVQPEAFLKIWKKTATFMTEPQRRPATDTVCRKPYSVTLRAGDSVQTRSGCRLGDEGTTLARLARELEFLMMSGRPSP